MPDPTNAEIAALLDELGDLYELDGAIIHRVTAYRNAAKAVRDATTSIAARVRAGTVTEIPGIGKTLEEKLVALVETGEIPATVKLRAKFPAGLVQMTRLPGLGPKRARKLFDELGIDSLEALRTAAEGQTLREVKGFGPKFEATVISALDAGAGDAPRGRVPLHEALAIAEPLLAALRDHPASERVVLAGSARRWVDSVKDLDIIATASDPAALAEAFAGFDLLETSGGVGDAGARGRTHSGLAIDLKIVAPEQFGNLLQHFTGSKQHNVALREAAVKRGLHVSEYGLKDDSTGETHRCETEEQVYELLGLPYIEPELREHRGELGKGWQPPTLVTVDDLRGDLHSHTTASDGHGTITEMAQAAMTLGHEYLAVTDHSASHGFGNDVSPTELKKHMAAVRRASDKLDGITLLAGSEVNILTDGSLDYDDDLLGQLDWVVASVHTQFAMTADDMTKRIIRAIEHPLVDAIAHPTGRLIEKRQPYGFDMDAVIEAAARTGTFLEINGSPRRRDLNDVHARAAVAAGVKLIISSDAHRTTTLDNKRWGVATARRAGLGPESIANTLPLGDLLQLRRGR